MATIRTAIELHDLFTAPMMNIVQAVSMGVSAMGDMQAAMNEPVSASIAESITEQMNQAVQAIEEARAALSEPVTHENTGITWDSPTMPTFTNTGIERFEQEIQSANSMLEQLSSTQADIASMASRTAIFPANIVNDMSTMQSRIQAIQERIQTIESNPLNLGTDRANAELEGLRSQLDQAVHEQNRLNAALEQMDVSAANEAYIRLSHTVSNTERYIRDNVDEQGRFNQEINEGVSNADNLMDTIKGLVATYATIQTVGNVIELSDTMTQTTARLDLIVDDGGSVAELQNKIYASAQNARGSYIATADAVSKLGMQASQAFNSNDELIAFTELLNKQFVNAGTSAQGIDSVMLQLTQSMAAGRLQGEELSAVLENATPIIQNIQRYLEEVQGIDASNIKELASEGVITAEIIKNSMFYAADEINAKFESMPMTFGQIWQQFENTALMAFQPVLQRMNDLANNEAFNVMVENAVNALATVANIVLNIFEVMAAVGSFMYENWSILEPLVYGLVAALALYAAYLGITKAAELASAAGKVIMCVAAYAHAVATGAEVAATTAATAAQYGGGIYFSGNGVLSQTKLFHNAAGKGGDDYAKERDITVSFAESVAALAPLFESDNLKPIEWEVQTIDSTRSGAKLLLEDITPTEPEEPDETEPEEPEQPTNPDESETPDEPGESEPDDTEPTEPGESEPSTDGEQTDDPTEENPSEGDSDTEPDTPQDSTPEEIPPSDDEGTGEPDQQPEENTPSNSTVDNSTTDNSSTTGDIITDNSSSSSTDNSTSSNHESTTDNSRYSNTTDSNNTSTVNNYYTQPGTQPSNNQPEVQTIVVPVGNTGSGEPIEQTITIQSSPEGNGSGSLEGMTLNVNVNIGLENAADQQEALSPSTVQQSGASWYQVAVLCLLSAILVCVIRRR